MLGVTVKWAEAEVTVKVTDTFRVDPLFGSEIQPYRYRYQRSGGGDLPTHLRSLGLCRWLAWQSAMWLMSSL